MIKISRPAVTYIVSAYDRPRSLRMTLSSLQVQTDPDFEVIVADNAVGPGRIDNHAAFADMDDHRFRYEWTGGFATVASWDCYWASDLLIAEGYTKGKFVCFPSDDTYYMPVFQETLLKHARANELGLVFPELLYDRRLHGKYAPLDTRICVGGIDKVCFMVRRDLWKGWKGKADGPIPVASCADGETVVELVRSGVKWGKVEEVLCIHN